MTLPRTFVINLRRSTDRWNRAKDHLAKSGITAERFLGMDASINGLYTSHVYEKDAPGSGYRMGPVTVALYLSHYILWHAMLYMPEDEFWILEDDAQWRIGWREDYDKARAVLPDDWDLLWLGSCCTEHMYKACIAGNLWEVKYPLCTHAYAIRKKALPLLLETHAKVWGPLDCVMLYDSMPKLRVYTILPRLCDQFNTTIQP